MPKYDNFVSILSKLSNSEFDLKNDKELGFFIKLNAYTESPRTVVFYMKVEHIEQSSNPILAIKYLMNSSKETMKPAKVDLHFKIRETKKEAWKTLECVRFKRKNLQSLMSSNYHMFTDFDLTTYNSFLIGLNRTHAVCQYELLPNEPNIFTVLTNLDNSVWVKSFLKFNNLTFKVNIFSIDGFSSPLTLILTLILCSISLWITIFYHRIRSRLIRIIFICSFIINSSVFFTLQTISIDNVSRFFIILICFRHIV